MRLRSMGVILYEMVVGCPPFHAENPLETQLKVVMPFGLYGIE